MGSGASKKKKLNPNIHVNAAVAANHSGDTKEVEQKKTVILTKPLPTIYRDTDNGFDGATSTQALQPNELDESEELVTREKMKQNFGKVDECRAVLKVASASSLNDKNDDTELNLIQSKLDVCPHCNRDQYSTKDDRIIATIQLSNYLCMPQHLCCPIGTELNFVVSNKDNSTIESQ